MVTFPGVFWPVTEALSMILPRHCIDCQRWIPSQESGQLGCDLCEQKWPDLRGSHGEMMMKERCLLECMWTGFRLGENAALERQIQALKYQGHRRLGLHLGRWVSAGAEVPFSMEKPIGLVPVPLHWRRRWKRGFNQADWIARGVAKEWEVPIYRKALIRHQHAQSHTGLSRRKRLDHSASAYRLGSAVPPKNVRIVLIDDVMTTGSTLRACASVLESSNYEVLGALTLALA